MAVAATRLSSVARTTRQEPVDFRLTLVMLVIVVAAAILRLYALDRTSLWSDEAASWNQARQPFWDMIQATAKDTAPPLHNVLLYATIRLLGDSEIALRLPSAIFGIANIYLVYRLGAVLWDQLTGVFAAALLALSGFHLWYSQEARPYALLALAATAFALATVYLLSRPNWLTAVLCAMAGAALLYTHVYGIFAWAGINAGAAIALVSRAEWTGPNFKLWAMANGVAGLSFLPWARFFVGQVRHVTESFWIPFPTPQFLHSLALSIAGGKAMLLTLALLVLVSFLAVSADDKRVRVVFAHTATPFHVKFPPLLFELGWQKIILLSWAATPLLLGYVVSIAGRPLLEDRYLICSLPPILLLAARGLHLLRFKRIVITSALAALLAFSLPAAHARLTSDKRDDFRSAVADFAGRFRSSDEAIFAQPGASNAVAYYFRKPIARQASVHNFDVDSIDWPNADRVWFFVRDSMAWRSEGIIKRFALSYRQEQEFHYYGITMYLYVHGRSPG
jgi:mannosyltransferase